MYFRIRQLMISSDGDQEYLPAQHWSFSKGEAFFQWLRVYIKSIYLHICQSANLAIQVAN
jgi:hypothetical protein